MPIDIKEQASENLEFIRGAMERAGRVSSASGAGGMVMGAIALGAMALAADREALADQLVVWILAAFAALGACATVSPWTRKPRSSRPQRASTATSRRRLISPSTESATARSASVEPSRSKLVQHVARQCVRSVRLSAASYWATLSAPSPSKL